MWDRVRTRTPEMRHTRPEVLSHRSATHTTHMSKATPCGADGREQVDLTAFLRPRGPESERSPPWPAVGLLRSLVVTKTDQHNALATKAITKTAR